MMNILREHWQHSCRVEPAGHAAGDPLNFLSAALKPSRHELDKQLVSDLTAW